jgi:hypothetical protein
MQLRSGFRGESEGGLRGSPRFQLVVLRSTSDRCRSLHEEAQAKFHTVLCGLAPAGD